MLNLEQPLKTIKFGAVEAGDDVVISANARTDLFFHPNGSDRIGNVPRYSARMAQSVFSLSAKVSVEFASAYDAGALFVEAGPDQWAKIAFEFSPQGVPTIVSVVTKGVSDDCDGPRLPASHAHLRIYREDNTFALHFSEDGRLWRFLRWFSLDLDAGSEVEIGLSSQSPTGNGCKARFSDIALRYVRIDDLRNGT